MTYIPEESKVIYQSKDGKDEKVFDALEWPRQKVAGCKYSPAMCSHMPNKGEQMVRYRGFYSNVNRGKRIKQHQDKLIPSVLEPVWPSKEFRKNWARLIQKIYACPSVFVVQGGPTNMPEVPREDSYNSVHRGSGGYQKNSQTPRSMEIESKTPAQGQYSP